MPGVRGGWMTGHLQCYVATQKTQHVLVKNHRYGFSGTLILAARKLRPHRPGVEAFWCYGSGVIYRADAPADAHAVEREQWSGSYVHVSHEQRTSQLFYTSLSNEETPNEI